MARLTFGGIITIAAGALTSSPIEAMERPLAWISLPADWPAETPITLQGALSQAATAPLPDADSWQDITNMVGRPITFLGLAGHVMALQEGVFLGLPFLRLRIGTAVAVPRAIPYGVRWVPE